MKPVTTSNWLEANQRYLMAAVAEVRAQLERHIERTGGSPGAAESSARPSHDLEAMVADMQPPPAVETLRSLFNLSPFERGLLLLCAAPELDSSFARLCATAQGDPSRPYPTFSLALAALDEPHWSALSPQAPLRLWRLIEIGSGGSITTSPLRIDERVLHYVAGIQHTDERLRAFIRLIPPEGDMAPSHRDLAIAVARSWSKASGNGHLPLLQLTGGNRTDRRMVASEAAALLGLNLQEMASNALSSDLREVEHLARLWEREAALTGSAVLIECDEMDLQDTVRMRAIATAAESIGSAVVVSSRERMRVLNRPAISFDVPKPTAHEQLLTWSSLLGDDAGRFNGQIEKIVSQFSLSEGAIRAAVIEARSRLGYSGESIGSAPDELSEALWDTCRVRTRPRFDTLAQRIEPAAVWKDLVLPDLQKNVLREIAIHLRQRFKVYDLWGFAAKSARGLGISALFTGPSGTGKTMAAEVLAKDLHLDLYRIDLSQVVSKYIGETEKNLRRVFDEVEDSGAILLFDEADALFGKRSEVIRDSHDRYANIEISYLLQKMEEYRGLAILTTNMKEAIDKAFLRRIRFVVRFPFPDAGSRAEIWRRVFPTEAQTHYLDVSKLARLNVAGGNIRNISMNAAFLAADECKPIGMRHLLQATRSEYAKLEKPLTDTEIQGWL